MSRSFHSLFLTLALVACVSKPTPYDEGRFVVEGWIDDGAEPVVLVTSLVTASSQPQRKEDLEKHLIAIAEVVVTEGDHRYTLTGRRDEHYLPPYVYTTDAFKGEAGKTYGLEVRYLNRTCRGSATIPEASEVESFTVTPESDTLYSLKAKLRSRAGASYKFFTRVEKRDSTFCSSLLGVVRGNGERMEVPVSRGWSILTEWRQPLFRKGEIVHVRCCSIEDAMYDFWKSFDDVTSLARNPIFPVTTNVVPNLQGAYGYWAGYGAREYTVEIK